MQVLRDTPEKKFIDELIALREHCERVLSVDGDYVV